MSIRRPLKLRNCLALCLLAVFGICPALTPALANNQPAFGTISVFAPVPATPGFPEGVAVHGNSVFVSGPARFGTAGTGPSTITVYNRKTGALDQIITVQGEFLAFEHALSNIAIDGQGRVYALSTQLGLLQFTKQGQAYVQSAYGAPLPDIPPVGPAFDFPPIPNDVVFDDAGNAYVTDSLQATIFRYGPGGGVPTIFLQDAAFNGSGAIPFGPNGIRLDPARQNLYMVTTTSPTNPGEGTIYRIPLNNPTAFQPFFTYSFFEGPDQLAFANDGTLYVSLAFANQIGFISTGAVELGRVSSALSDPVPMDNPAGICFDSRSKSLFVANHALLSGNPAHFAVLSIYVNNPGDPLVEP